MITIHEHKIMIEQYQEVQHITTSEIRVMMKHQIIEVKGVELQVLALSKYEILIAGKIEGLLFYEDK